MKQSSLKQLFKNALITRFDERIGAEDYEEVKAYVILRASEMAEKGRITEAHMLEVIEHIEETDKKLKEESDNK